MKFRLSFALKPVGCLVFITALTFNEGLSQRMEYLVSLNSGLFSFGGATASKTTFFNFTEIASHHGYANNPYGRKSGFSYGLSVTAQRVTKGAFLYGADAGYESLASRITIVNSNLSSTTYRGKAILINRFVNLRPMIGKRFNLAEGIIADLLIGVDLAVGQSSEERVVLKSPQGPEIEASNDRHIPSTDVRPVLMVRTTFGRTGLNFGYARGTINYTEDIIGADREAKSRYFRIGLSYSFFQGAKSTGN